MKKTTLTPSEIEKAEKLLAAYFSQHHNQGQLRRDTQEGEQEQELFTQVLIHNSCPKDKDFLNFLHDRIWAIHESLRFGLLDDIVRENTVDQIRAAFRNMLLNAPSIADADSVLAVGKRPYLGVSILSEALCKVYPDHFSIKNKRSEWALYFILSNAGPDYIENKLSGSPRYRFIESSDVEGENLYTALGQTEAGRYLTVYFVHKKTGEALIVSARDMTRKERRAYGR